MGEAVRNTKIKKEAPISKKLNFRLSIGLVFLLAAPGVFAAADFNLNANYNQEIWELNQQINDKRKEAQDLRKQADVYQKSLSSKRREISSLNYQISTINQTMTKISLEKEAIEVDIEKLGLQIQNSQLKIQATEENMAEQKDRLAELIRTLYQNDKQNNLLVILATNNTFSEYLTQIQSLQNLQGTVLNGLDSLGELKVALVDEQKQLDDNRTSLTDLHGELDAKSDSLQEQRNVKFSLIDETKGQESKYQELINQLKGEQDRINNDIVSLEQVAREKLNRQLQSGARKDLGSGPMTWPIPGRTITAFFHDPDYPYRNIFEHPAIDVRSPQGSPIYAAASGYVARAKDAGMGYSYIMLLHDNGISTVYGHVSGINVTEGSFVTQGQIIGLTGGKPGTPGAGPLTTGPHLHFEVRLNGIPVNPLNYLPQ
ncbi:MAG: peptidoglycan DD-metalloendopeptidase family protein [Candidatus Komeilibacteria bacterium]|nr:peptidoglycan DD-metalloendopeptidase family protein [Candidatus Komeilibacteria bacterium]